MVYSFYRSLDHCFSLEIGEMGPMIIAHTLVRLDKIRLIIRERFTVTN